MMILGLIRRHREIPIKELCIYDTSEEKREVIGAIIRHLALSQRAPFAVRIVEDAAEAVRGADFIYTAIRVGGEHGRVVDEKAALRHGVLGQETTGPGGLAMALRTIPVMLEYADMIEREAPRAWVINFTNPAGLITEALCRHTKLKVIGICDAPSALKLDIARFLGERPEEVYVNYFGLNHLGWINRVLVRGEDRLPEIVGNFSRFAETSPHMGGFSPELIRRLGMIPNEYLYYYYYRDQAVDRIIKGGRTRGEQVAELNRKLIAELQPLVQSGDMDGALKVYSRIMAERHDSYMAAETGTSRPQQPHDDSRIFEDEGYAGLAMGVLSAICGNRKSCFVLNVPNQGALEGLAPDDVAEVPCMVDANGPVPLAVGKVPDAVKGLIHSVKQYERLAVSAAVNGSREDALMALAIHPLVCSVPLAERILDDYLNEHASHLPQFGKRRTTE
jgi:6-phospho-beta-glucosidase